MNLSERLKRLPEWLLPGACLLCGTRIPWRRDFCDGCDQALPRLGHACFRCASPYAEPSGELPCGACQQHPPPYLRVRAPFRYAAPVDGLVQGGKYAGRLDWLAALGRQLSESLTPYPLEVDALVPVPLHRSRLRERGYNQSLELARPLAKRLKLPIHMGVERVRATATQTGLSRDERRSNLREAFAVRGTARDMRLAIIDDVMTSGATADALTRCLLKAGAKSVEVWVMARA
jgi:ComF family protein